MNRSSRAWMSGWIRQYFFESASIKQYHIGSGEPLKRLTGGCAFGTRIRCLAIPLTNPFNMMT